MSESGSKIKTAVFVSGGGTNLQALIDAEKSGIIRNASLSLVISDHSEAYALKRAQIAGIPTATVEKKDCASQADFESRLNDLLEKNGIDLIVLAGFMRILSADFTSRYPERILNVHPSLIPRHCGKGYYGLKVHEAVLECGDKVTGATVHFVNEIPDGGKIIAQRSVEVREGDTAESLQKRVMREAEWIILPEAVEATAADLLRKFTTEE